MPEMVCIDIETLAAIRSELGLLRLACYESPEMPVGQIHDCACMGPSHECRCKKRERLIAKFLDAATQRERLWKTKEL